MVLLAALGLTVLGGCGRARNAVPVELVPEARLAGYPDVRGWWENPQPVENSLRNAIRQSVRGEEGASSENSGSYDVLCLSGGGAGGAFGAGLLCGWSEAGNRPEFFLVTGVSTGALIAPFAFLGREYDGVLRRFSSGLSTRDIMTKRPLVTLALGADSIASSAPLARLLEECVDDRVVAAVAREHARGRRLFIGTTHLDAGRLVVWDMGAIAASGRSDAPDLFRKVMLASASIPVAFPAQYFHVEANGQSYDEMHVDGGVMAEVFLYGVALDAQKLWQDADQPSGPRGRVYVVRNGYLRVPGQPTRPGLMSIGERAIHGFLGAKATGDVYHVHALASRDGMDFNLAYVPEDLVTEQKEAFDPNVMGQLFTFGQNLARNGFPWQKTPPGLDPSNAGSPLLTARPTPSQPPQPENVASASR
jgi:hypothetical protein